MFPASSQPDFCSRNVSRRICNGRACSCFALRGGRWASTSTRHAKNSRKDESRERFASGTCRPQDAVPPSSFATQRAINGIVSNSHASRLSPRETEELNLRLASHGAALGLFDYGIGGVRWVDEPPATADLRLQPGDQVTDAGLGHHRSFLLQQPLPDPASGVTLFPRRLQVLDQPTPDRGLIRAQHRRRPGRRLPGRRDRVSQRLTDRAAVDLGLPASALIDIPSSRASCRIRSNCSTLDLTFTPALLGIAWQTNTNMRGTGRSRVGPHQASTTAPTGATSGCHTQLEMTL